MNFSKYVIEDRIIPGIALFSIVLIIISIYLQSQLVFFLACFFLIVAGLNQLYLKKAGMGLLFKNKMDKRHLFKEEDGQWTLVFQNSGYPILNAKLSVYYDDNVRPLDEMMDHHRSVYEIIVPFSILTNQTRQFTIPYKSVKRGVAKIRRLEIHIPSLIGFGKTVIDYQNIVRQEAVVYPSPIPVKGLKEQTSVLQGGSAAAYSVYEDRLGPMGTRNYVPTDSFNRIHWKASAKKQSLQTKVFERISERGWHISINVADGYALTGELEQILSSVTEFAYYAVRNQIPYSLCINVRKAGNTPFYYVPKGEGKEHLQKILETLASISHSHSVFPYEKMLSFYYRHFGEQPYFLHAGIRSPEVNTALTQIGRKGVYITELKVAGEYGYLKRLNPGQEGRLQV